jgi:hypothetical protein
MYQRLLLKLLLKFCQRRNFLKMSVLSQLLQSGAPSPISACAQELETEVELEKQGSAALKEKFDVQKYELDVLKLKFGESAQARKKQLGEIEEPRRGDKHPSSLFVVPQQGVGCSLFGIGTLQIYECDLCYVCFTSYFECNAL